MKKIALALFLLVIGFSPPLRAQNSISGTLSAAGTSCSTANACLTLPLGVNIGGAGITVSANASGNTLQFEVSGDNATFSGASCTPTSSSTSATNTTLTGNWVCPASTLAGMSVLRVRMSTLAGGSSTVSINSSFASAKAGGGGTGSGTVTNVSGTANQIDVATGTTTPVVSLDPAIVLPGSLTAPTGGSITVSGTGTNNATDINGTHLASLGTGIVKNTTTTGVPSIAVAGDFPTLNQNTSGTAANLSGTPALPNGTTATSQSAGDNTTSLATDAFVTTAVNNAIAAVNPAVAVVAASTASITGTYTAVGAGIGDTFTVTATGAFSLDGVALNTIGQRVLLKNQASAYQNGVYTVTIPGSVGVSPVFTRALDYDQPSDVNNTGSIPVQSGTANSTTSWLLTSQVTSIGPAGSALTYAQFSLNPATVVTNASPLTNNAVMAGAGGSASKVTTTTDDGTTFTVSDTSGISSPQYVASGANGGIDGTEGTGASLTAAASHDLLYPDSTNHCWHANWNNADKGCVMTLTGTQTVAGAITFSTGPTMPLTNVTGSLPKASNPQGIFNYSTSSLTPGGSAGVFNYIAPSALTMPAVYTTAIGANTTMRWHFAMSKTAAGTGAFNIRGHLGTAGTTSDATLFTQSVGTATAALDDMTCDLAITFTSATAAYWNLACQHSTATATGFGLAVGSQQFSGTLSGLTTTTASLIFGLSYSNTTGTAVITVPQVFAQALGVN